MQNRHMSGEKTDAGTREEVLNGNGGMHHLTDLCLGEVVTCRSLGQVITCIYGSAVTFAFPNPYQWRLIDNRSLMPTW